MPLVIVSLSSAFRDLLQLKVLWIAIWPALIATLCWVVAGIVFWDNVSVWIESALDQAGIQHWLGSMRPRWVADGIQATLHLILFVPLIFLTTLLITAFFAMPGLIRIVADQHFPHLARESGGSLAANVVNGVIAVLLFAGIWVVTLPLWLIGVGALVPFVAATYLNQRLFRFDALAEHASADEMQQLFRSDYTSWWGLGLATGLLQFVPLLNLFAPVVTGLAFIHFGLARLDLLRHPS